MRRCHMWPKAYRDYEIDKPLIKYQVEPSQGIIGCEMHDLNGWGTTLHIPRGRFAGIVRPRVEIDYYKDREKL